MKRLILALVASMALVACGTLERPTVNILPIPEACRVATPAKPAELYSPPYVSLHTATAHLLGDREATAGYIRKLETAFATCKQELIPETTKPVQP